MDRGHGQRRIAVFKLRDSSRSIAPCLIPIQQPP
jgi:hypothetical protein